MKFLLIIMLIFGLSACTPSTNSDFTFEDTSNVSNDNSTSDSSTGLETSITLSHESVSLSEGTGTIVYANISSGVKLDQLTREYDQSFISEQVFGDYLYYRINPVAGSAGDHEIVLSYSNGLEDIKKVIKISVQSTQPMNMPPTILLTQSSATVVEQTTTSVLFSAQDLDGQIADISINPSLAFLSISQSGSFKSLNITPKTGDEGMYQVMLVVTDDKGAKAFANLSLTIKKPVVQNIAPQVSLSQNTLIIDEGATNSVMINATDADGVISSVTISPALSFIKIENIGGQYRANISPVNGDENNYNVSFTATDNKGASAQANLMISVKKPVVAMPIIAKVELIDTTTNQVIRVLSDNETIDLAKVGKDISIIATPANAQSIRFLGGAHNWLESEAPFALNGDINGIINKHNFAVGNLNLTITPYSLAAAAGVVGTPRSLKLNIVENLPNKAPVISLSSSLLIVEEKKTGKINITVSDSDGEVKIVDYSPKSLFSSLTGSGANYSLNFAPKVADAGTQQITISATDDDGSVSTQSLRLEVTKAPVEGLAIDGLELVSAVDNSVIRTISNNSIIDLAKDGKLLSIVAKSSKAASIKFVMGAHTVTENTAPFALNGDIGVDYVAYPFTVGDYKLIAIPYPEKLAAGAAGTPYEINFKVVNNIPNTAPILSLSLKNIEVEESSEATVNITANDIDGNLKLVDYTPKMSFVSWSMVGGSYRFKIAPNANDVGVHTFNIKATDSEDASAVDQIVVSVKKKAVVPPAGGSFVAFKAAIDKGCVHCHGAPNSSFGGLISFYNQPEVFWQNSDMIVPGSANDSKLYYRIKKELTNINAPGGAAQNMPIGSGNGFNTQDANAIKDYINSMQAVAKLDCSNIDTSPSETDLRRLTTDELKFAISDILGGAVGLEALDALPRDGSFDGFTNVGARQQVSNSFVTKYYEAVESIVEKTVTAKMSVYGACTKTAACNQQLLFERARRAFSRELDSETQGFLNGIVNRLDNELQLGFLYIDGIKAGLNMILTSPSFLYVSNRSVGFEGKVLNLNEYELAKKLALTLWKSVPDSALLNVAKNENLLSKTVLTREIKRMMADPKFTRSREVFVDQWLRLGRLDNANPSPAIYGVGANAFNQLKPLLKQEVHEYVKYVSDQKLPIETFINGKFTVVDKTLANHYGMSHPGGGFRKVDISALEPRGGLSTLGAIIAMNSNSDRRSIVLSGVWFLNAMLCDEPPSPGNEIAAEVAAALASDAPHEDLAMERAANPSCAGCHGAIDGAGIAYNTFDSVGKIVDRDEKGRAVASAGQIYTKQFNNTSEFLEIIKAEKKFNSCLANKFMIYSTGEMLHPKGSINDKCKSQKVVDKLNGNNNFEQLIIETLLSENFLKRNVPGN